MEQDTVTSQIAAAHETIASLRAEVGRVVVGQQTIVDRLVIALLIRGHVLIEGLPGLAKTLLVKTLASAIDAVSIVAHGVADIFLARSLTNSLVFVAITSPGFVQN